VGLRGLAYQVQKVRFCGGGGGGSGGGGDSVVIMVVADGRHQS